MPFMFGNDLIGQKERYLSDIHITHRENLSNIFLKLHYEI